MKRGLMIGAAIVVVVLVAVVVVLLNLGSAIKTIVERVGSDATRAKVTLDSAEVALTSGKGTLRGLTIGNPAGYKTDHAIRLGEISVTLDVGTVNSNPIVIKEIVVGSPQVTYEFGPVGSNLDALRRNVEAYGGGGAGEGARPKTGDEAGDRRLVIENLYVRDGRVDVSAGFLKDKMGTTLPEIHIKNIGRRDGAAPGASAAEVTRQVIAAIARASRGAVGKLDVTAIQDALKGGTEELLKEGAGSTGKAVESGTQKVQEQMKKLFGR